MSSAPWDPDSLGVYEEPEQPGLYPSDTMLDASSEASASLSRSASWYAGSSSDISPTSSWRSGNIAAMASMAAGSMAMGTALVGTYDEVCI